MILFIYVIVCYTNCKHDLVYYCAHIKYPVQIYCSTADIPMFSQLLNVFSIKSRAMLMPVFTELSTRGKRHILETE